MRLKAALICAAAICVLSSIASEAQASTITVFTSRALFDTAVGPTTIDDFGPKAAFPITTGVLDSTTSLVTTVQGPIVPGTVQPGVTYSTAIGTNNFFNIDAGVGYTGGFLSRVSPGSAATQLNVAFASPILAFGFDTSSLMGNELAVTVNFSSGAPFATTLAIPAGVFSFFGFQAAGADIVSATIFGNDNLYAFAVDNFAVTPMALAADPAVPEPASMLLLGSGVAALVARRRTSRR